MSELHLKHSSKRPYTTLCAVLKKPTFEKIAYANQAADLIEFRIDLFDEEALTHLKQYREAVSIPVIFTLRDEKSFPCLALKPDFVDLDHKMENSLFLKIREKNIKVIASKHDRDGDLFQKPADIYKQALPASSLVESLRMVVKNQKEKRPFIGLCTGELGEVTRILSRFSYAPVSKEDQTAPGQILLRDLSGIYRYREIDKNTHFYGLIGDPIEQSPSHLVHNFAFSELKINARYVKLRVQKEELEEAIHLLKTVGFKGLSVTIPHKETVATLFNLNGPINTIKFSNEVFGFNTDGIAAMDLIEKKKRGKKMVILGEGGTALGIGKEALKRGFFVTFLSRTPKKGSYFLSSFGDHDYDVLINATPSFDVIPYEKLLSNRLVMDVNLKPSPLLDAAREKNCDVIEGRELFFKQAAFQYEHWFNPSPI